MTNTELCQKAISAAVKAYAPYSGFSVGAALLCADGTLFTGCNIENAAFTPTVCAERVAFFKAISEGKKEFTRLAVVGMKELEIKPETAPCGVCRQVMAEFCEGDFEILLVISATEYKTVTLAQLLPFRFGKESMQ